MQYMQIIKRRICFSVYHKLILSTSFIKIIFYGLLMVTKHLMMEAMFYNLMFEVDPIGWTGEAMRAEIGLTVVLVFISRFACVIR